MATLHVKSPNGTEKAVDVDKICTTDGFTMNGDISFNSSEKWVKKSDDNGSIGVAGGILYGHGGSISLFGKNNSTWSGSFWVTAHDGTNEVRLIGKPDGTLAWNGKEVIREMAKSLSTKSGYCKLNNGLLLQYGTVAATAFPYTLTFPIAWSSDDSYAMSICHAGASTSRISYSRITNSQAKLYLENTGDTFWMAIGY